MSDSTFEKSRRIIQDRTAGSRLRRQRRALPWKLQYEFDECLEGADEVIDGDQTGARRQWKCCRELMGKLTRDEFPDYWARLQFVLGNACRTLYEVSMEPRLLLEAEEAYKSALLVWPGKEDPAGLVGLGQSLARLYTMQGRWDSAHQAYEQVALPAARDFRATLASDRDRRRLLGLHAQLFQEDAICLIHLGRLADALTRTEEGRAQGIGQALALEERTLARYGDEGLERLRWARHELEQAEFQLFLANAEVERAQSPDERRVANIALEAATDFARGRRANLEAFAGHAGAFGVLPTLLDEATKSQAEFELKMADTSLGAAKTSEERHAALFRREHSRRALLGHMLAPEEPGRISATIGQTNPVPGADVAVIELVLTHADPHALIAHGETIQAVPLPDFSIDDIVTLIGSSSAEAAGWVTTGIERNNALLGLEQAGLRRITDLVPQRERLEAAEKEWQRAKAQLAASSGDYEAGWYDAYRLASFSYAERGDAQAARAAKAGWRRAITGMLASLAVRLWAPIVRSLHADLRHVLLIPPGLAALLPLHAAAPTHLTVAYCPSLAVWRSCQIRAEHRSVGAVFLATPSSTRASELSSAVADRVAPSSKGVPLPFSRDEASWIAARYTTLNRSVQWLAMDDFANSASVVAGMRGKNIIHYAGHARYNWMNPDMSTLDFAFGPPVQLQTLRSTGDLSASRLVTLSACESGLTDMLSGYEFVGLPVGLMEAGAPAVVGTHWPVYDISTAFLMDRFYENWAGNEATVTIADALHRAVLWLQVARKAELIARVAERIQPGPSQDLLLSLIEQIHMGADIPLPDLQHMPAAARSIAILASDPPFASPEYWAPFAAYGAVL